MPQEFRGIIPFLFHFLGCNLPFSALIHLLAVTVFTGITGMSSGCSAKDKKEFPLGWEIFPALSFPPGQKKQELLQILPRCSNLPQSCFSGENPAVPCSGLIINWIFCAFTDQTLSGGMLEFLIPSIPYREKNTLAYSNRNNHNLNKKTSPNKIFSV